jgi:hypothetical protein
MRRETVKHEDEYTTYNRLTAFSLDTALPAPFTTALASTRLFSLDLHVRLKSDQHLFLF